MHFVSAAILFRMTDFVIWMPYSICLRNLRRGFEKRVKNIPKNCS